MVIHRRKKAGRYRGHTTHGHGHRKKRRGAGSRGGRGRAGSGKRSGHKKNLFAPLGKHGFTSIWQKRDRVINLGYFTPAFVQRLQQERKAVKEKEFLVVDLATAGYDKLLGAGTVTAQEKIKFIVPSWSAQAEERVKAAGGVLVKSHSPE